MLINNNYYIEIASNNHRQMGQMVCGDVFLKKQYNNHVAAVLCNGGGSGSKSNVIASVMASMALNHTTQRKALHDIAKIVLSAFYGKGDAQSKPSMTLVTVSDKAEVSVVECGSPHVVLYRKDKELSPNRVKHSIKVDIGEDIEFTSFNFLAEVEDRVVFVSEGVVGSGLINQNMPQGWGLDGLKEKLIKTINGNLNISAMSLCNEMVDTARINDLNSPKKDMSCGAIYFRTPRKLLVCTGPPFDMRSDNIMATLVKNYSGDIIVSGGSTSQIIARELGRELELARRKDVSGLPSSYTMEGIKLVTEGVLTLGRVKSVLDNLRDARAKGEGIDIVFVNELLEHDMIDFVVGTKVNELHQNPNIPIELELRRTVISDIARMLETRFMKVVSKRYL